MIESVNLDVFLLYSIRRREERKRFVSEESHVHTRYYKRAPSRSPVWTFAAPHRSVRFVLTVRFGPQQLEECTYLQEQIGPKNSVQSSSTTFSQVSVFISQHSNFRKICHITRFKTMNLPSSKSKTINSKSMEVIVKTLDEKN